MLRNDTGLITWVLTDGKAGDELQALSVTEALGLDPEIRRVDPKPPFDWFMPWGPIDPRERPGAPNSPLAPPFPDLLVASGRRAVAYLRFVKKATGGRTYTVFLKDPRTGPKTADFIWSPDYDRLRGPNVLNTLTPPHRVSEGRIAAARSRPDPRLAHLPHPHVAVLAGGDSRHHRFTQADIARFVEHLTAVAEAGAGLMVTASRRTPQALRDALDRAHRPAWRLFLGRRGGEPLCRPPRSRRFRGGDGRFLQHDRRGRRDGTADPGVRTFRRTPETGCLHGGPESSWNCASVRGAS